MRKFLPRTHKLLYVGSKSAFSSTAWHTACDGKGPTVTYVKTTTGHIFGIFTDIPWATKTQKMRLNSLTFAFKVMPNGDSYNINVKKGYYEVWHYAKYMAGLYTGGATIYDRCNTNAYSQGAMDTKNYMNPPYAAGTVSTSARSTWLAGAARYKCSEVETY